MNNNELIEEIKFSFNKNDNCICKLYGNYAIIIDNDGEIFDINLSAPMNRVFGFKFGLILQRVDHLLSSTSVSDELEDAPVYYSLVNPLDDIKPISYDNYFGLDGVPVLADFIKNSKERLCNINSEFSLVLTYNEDTKYYSLWSLRYTGDDNDYISNIDANFSYNIDESIFFTSEVFFDFLWRGTCNNINYNINNKYYFINDDNNTYMGICDNNNKLNFYIIPLIRSKNIISLQPISNVPVMCASVLHKYLKPNEKNNNITVIEDLLYSLSNVNYYTSDNIINYCIYSLYDVLSTNIAFIIHYDILKTINNNYQKYDIWDIFVGYFIRLLNVDLKNDNNIDDFTLMEFYMNENNVNNYILPNELLNNIKINSQCIAFCRSYMDTIFLSWHYISENLYIQLNYEKEYNKLADFLQLLSLIMDNTSYINYYQRKTGHVITNYVYFIII